MKAIVVNCFDTYEDRVDLVHEVLKEQGYAVKVIQSDFRHLEKVHRVEPKENFVFVKSKPYDRNLSVSRLWSHYNYAVDAFKLVAAIKPDLLYTFVPPNSLARLAARYKTENKGVKLILDLMDLWPESMPIGNAKKYPPFAFWGAMRDRSLKHADIVITECDLYQTVLKDVLEGLNTTTVHLAKKEIYVRRNTQLSNDQVNLAYLGSINSIIDMPKIRKVIEIIAELKPVTLHLIGDGASRQELIDAARAGGASVEYHGIIYDPQEKQAVFDRCHFGLNIMKDDVCVGLTLKSIDYFQHGLPIINSIRADTAEMVETYGVGVNVDKISDRTIKEIEKWLNSDGETARKRVLELFSEKFSAGSFNGKLVKILNELEINCAEVKRR